MAWRRRVREKWPYLIMYLSFLVGGVVAMFYPTNAVLTAMERGLAYAWAGTLASGGALAFVGCVRGGLAGENVGIPLCASANWMFAVAVLTNGASTASIAVAIVFLGVGFGILGRWRDIRALLRTAINTPRPRS